VVVDSVRTAEDLPPNAPISERSTLRNPAGNYIVIQTADDEYVIVAHMQQGSVRVQTGDEVHTGDVLGLVGNSGNSSEPHLHIHLQTTPDLLDFQAQGIPLRFDAVVVDGQVRNEVIPEQGSFVAPE
jgi:murein DD-endopeptidase MepM/ murein hydrolase activator NlpD